MVDDLSTTRDEVDPVAELVEVHGSIENIPEEVLASLGYIRKITDGVARLVKDTAPQKDLHIESGMDMILKGISESEQQELAKRIVFSTGAGSVDGVDLTTEMLERNGLLPKWEIRFDDTAIYIADKTYTGIPGRKKSRRKCAIIYVESETRGVVARSCYKSISQAVWRLLPAYTRRRFDKGYGGEQLTLPPEIQRALNLCETQQLEDADKVFFGTVQEGIALSKTFQEELEPYPISLGEGFYTPTGRKVYPEDPESFKFDDETDKPNFSQVTDSWTEDLELYGPTVFELFESQNGRLRYLFCRCNRPMGGEKAWIAGIDLKKAGMSSQGIKKQWIMGGDLCTPAYEYHSQAVPYGSTTDIAGEKDEYADVYEKYLSRIPLIQEYQASVAARAA